MSQVKHRTLLHDGFLKQTFGIKQIIIVSRILNIRYQHKFELFEAQVHKCCQRLTNELRDKLVAKKNRLIEVERTRKKIRD